MTIELHQAFINVVYYLIAMCVAYKLAFILRQTCHCKALSMIALRIFAFLLAAAVMVKAFYRFEGGDPAGWFDIGRELMLCGFLASTIFMLKNRFGRF